MNLHIKALLLSAFILPGLGQLSKGDKIKGFILILLVNIFLLGALFLVIQGLGPAIVAAKLSGPAEAQRLLEELPAKAPVAKWLIAGFVGLWLYSAIDAAIRPPSRGDGQ